MTTQVEKKSRQCGRILPVLILLLLVGLSCSAWSSASDDAIDQTRLEAFVDGVVTTAMADHRIAGTVVAVVYRGEPILLKGYGYARESERVAVDPEHTLFRVASITKLFNAIALVQLVDAGLVDLDADFTRYLPDIDFDLPYGTVRVRDLLTHTAGFADGIFGHFSAIAPDSDHSLRDYVVRFQPHQVRPPGEDIVYSNYGTAVIGLIIEEVSETPYSDYVEQFVLQPLGMLKSAMRDWPGEERAGALPLGRHEHLALTHAWASGRFRTPDRANWAHAGTMPLGGLLSTGSDMARFMLAQLGDGGGIVSPQGLELLHTPSISNHPAVAHHALGFWVGDLWGYQTLMHGGSIFGFLSDLVMLPELDLGIFVSTNSPSGSRLSAPLARRIVENFFPSQIDIPRPDADADLSEYTGRYRSQRRGYQTIDKLVGVFEMNIGTNDQGFLTVAGSGGSTARLVALGDDQFINADTGSRLAFSRDAAGRIVLLHASFTNFERLSWWQTVRFIYYVLAALVLAFVVWVFVLAFSRRSGGTEARAGFICRYSSFALLLAWCVFLAVFAMDISRAMGPSPIHFAQFPTGLGQVWIWLTWIGTALTAVMALSLVPIWAGRQWVLSRRLAASALLICSAAFVFVLAYWNVLGARALG